MNTDVIKQKESNHSTLLGDMSIIAHGADGFLLFPTKKSVKEAGALEAIHAHVYYEFFFATASPLTIVTERGNQDFIDSIVIIPPRLRHFSCCEGSDGYCITVTAENVRTMRENGLLDYIAKDRITVLSINEAIVHYLKNLTAEDGFSRFGKAKRKAFLQLIFLEIASLLSAQDTALSGETVNQKYRYIEKIDRFIGKNYNKPTATIGDLAKVLYLSERQAARVVKREYGCTFVELLNEKKMFVAALLLKNTALSVREIIKELQFETENYFYRMFKKRYGITPKAYRKKFV